MFNLFPGQGLGDIPSRLLAWGLGWGRLTTDFAGRVYLTSIFLSQSKLTGVTITWP